MKILKNLILVIFLLLSWNMNVLANDKLAYIDINYLIQNSNLGKEISKNLNTINNDNIKKITSKEKKLIGQENEIKKMQNILSKEELKIKVLKLRGDIEIFNKEKNNNTKKFNKEKNIRFKVFFDKINPLITEYMNKESITIIIDKKNIFIGKSSHDITQDILKDINSKFN
tara:strand:- start:58 stop:570 length:513 start_codon:yes stop_codon:yes gene_type:complete